MIYPQGKVVHQNLSAEYTDVSQLLNTLRANGFSGIIEIEAEDKKGAFFLASGQVINAAIGLKSNFPALVGEPAEQELYLLAKQPKSLLHVSELSAPEIEILTGPFSSELVFKDLSTDFIRMEQFVDKLSNEKHTGYIEIFDKTGAKIGTLLFRNGEVTGFQMISGSGVNMYEAEAVASALDYAVRNGAVFNVYRNTAGISESVNGSRESVVQDTTSVAAPLAGQELEAAEPATAEPVLEPESEPKASAKAQESSFTDRLAEQMARMQEPAAIDNEAASEVVKDESSVNRRMEFISNLQRVLAKLESFTDHIGGKGDFQRLFRHDCVEKSDDYHFLDPFEGQFTYDSGKINLSDDVSSEDFAIATANCMNTVLTNLNKNVLKGAALPPGLKGEIETAFRNYKEVIRNSGLQSIVPANMR